MKITLLVALAIIGSWLAYVFSIHRPMYFPPESVAEMVELSCKRDDSKGISITKHNGDYLLATCTAVIDFDEVHRASATVSSGRPFLFRSTVVCRYDVDFPETIRFRCEGYVDGI